MRKIVLTLLSCLFMSLCFAQNDNVLTEDLQKILNQKSDELIEVNIFLKSKMPAEHLTNLGVKSDSRSVRREIVVNELKKFSEQSQQNVLSVINAETRSSNVVDVKSHWLVNYINCKASRDVIYQLAQHPDIKYIDYSSELELCLEGESDNRNSGTQGKRDAVTQTGKLVSDNITHVQADKVWDLGYTGKGIIVAVLDSGFNTDHVDLKDHLWYDEGASYPGYNFVFNSQPPTDDSGHGTHCAGTVCGDGTSGLTTGMAPDATLMPLKITNRSTGVSAGLERMVPAVEYAVENGADIISISVGFWSPSAYIKEALREAFTNSLQAGVVVAQAAGNNRQELPNYPAPNNINTPGDCPPPWFHPDQTTQVAGTNTSVICVGGIDENNTIIGVSSQGPVTWTNTSYGDYPYNPGMGLIRPDIVAPGAGVKSLDYQSNDGYDIKAGTSQAAPCVAGVMALMLEKNPDLTPADLCRIIETTATKLTDTKSNDYGSGCINALAAVQAVEFNVNAPYLSQYSFTKNITAGSNQSIELTLINNGKLATNGTTNVTITTNDNNITIVNGNATYAAMAANATATGNFTIKVSELVADNYKAILNVNAGNDRNFEIEINVSNPLLPPSSVSASASGKTITLSWNETNHATSYNIYRDNVYIDNVTSTSYVDENLEYGTLYTYTITTKRGELESERSREIRVQTDDNPEAPSPTNVVATDNNSSVAISWNNSTGSKGSNIYRKDNMAGTETQIASNISGSSYTDNISLQDGIYQYGVANLHTEKETIYEEGFENNGTSIPSSDWSKYSYGDGVGSEWGVKESQTTNNTTFTPYMGNYAAFSFYGAPYNKNFKHYLVTSSFDLSEYQGSDVTLSFYYLTPAWTNSPSEVNNLNIRIGSSQTGPWDEPIWTSNKTDVTQWTKAEVNLTPYVGNTFYIAFENEIGYGLCSAVDNVSIAIDGSKESRIEWSEAIHKNVNVFSKDGDWNNTDNWAAKRLPTENDTYVTIDANAVIYSGDITVNSLTINEGKSLTINSGAKLTVRNDFNNNDPNAFIINDGAQVVHNSENLPATFNMNITNPMNWSTSNTTGWQFIASPVKNAKISDFIPESSDYDLYKYDGTKNLEWLNHKDENVYEDTIPYAPVVTATPISSSSILFSWEAVDGATGYNVYSAGNLIAEITGTSYTANYLYYPNTEYCFSFSSVNENGESALTEACATTLNAKPITPYDFTATATGESTIELSWSPSNRTTSYNIYKGDEKIATVTGTTYTVEELEAGTEYCFTVTAENEMGESDKTEEKCATTNKKAPTIVEVGINPDGSELVYLPVYDYSAYSISQQIYTSNDIALGSGKIRNISFRVGDKGSAATRQYEVYLKNITASSFQENGYEYFELSSSDKVYDGSVAVGNKQEWFTIEFTTDFEYTGGNVVLCVYDKTGTALNSSSYHNFYKYAASGRSLYNSGYNAYNPTTLATNASRMATAYVNQIRFGIVPDGPVAPAMPSLSAVATSSSEISLTWNSVPGATSYNVYQGNNKIAEGLTETAHVVGNLEAGTEYCFAVTAVNEIGESAKSEACVMTEEALCKVIYTLKDSWGDGWNGNKLSISDGVDTEEVTLESGRTASYERYYQTGTNITITYIKGSSQSTAPGENSFVIQYEGGEVIFSQAQGSLSGTTDIGTFVVDCTPKAPNAPELTAKATSTTSITLSWNSVSGADSYNVYQDGNSIATDLTGTTYDVADLTAGEEYCFTVTAVNEIGESEPSEEACATPEEMCDVVFTFNDSYYDYGYGLSGATFTISYGGEPEQKSLSATSREFTLPIPSGSIVTATFNAGPYPYYISYVSLDVKYAGGDVIISLAKGSLSDGYSFEFTVDCTPKAPNAPELTAKATSTTSITLSWNSVSGADSYSVYQGSTQIASDITEASYTVEGLDAETEYCFTVTAVNEVGESEVSNEECVMTKGTDDPNSSASTFFYNFDDGSLEDFILIDNDGDKQNWETTKVYGKDDYIAISYSWKSGVGALSPDNYLITKNKYSITENSKIKFTVNAVNNCPEYYSVIIATNVNDIGSFISVYEGSCSSSDTTGISVDLSERAGSVFYIGIRHYNSYNQYNLSINDFQLTDGTAKGKASENHDKSNKSKDDLTAENNAASYETTVNAANHEVASNHVAKGNAGVNNDIVKLAQPSDGVFLVNPFENEDIAATRNNSRSKFESAFQQGIGYLASYEKESTAVFKGNLNHEKSYEFPVAYNSDKDLANFHLLGNPFSFNMKWGKVVSDHLATGYAVVNEQGGYTYYTDGEIKVGDGFFVKAIEENPSFYYNEGQRSRDIESLNINVVVNGNAGSDNVVINLADTDNEGFPKFKNFNEEIATIFVNENGKSYGVFNADKDVNEIPLYFRANEMGRYNINIEATGDFENITLVDLISGKETDMLMNDYSFTATSKEDRNRFIVRFTVSDKQSAVNNFVYQSGKDLVINAKGTVQIVDVMGRIIYDNIEASENTRIDVSNFRTGTYIVRLVSEAEVKTQKVVVY